MPSPIGRPEHTTLWQLQPRRPQAIRSIQIHRVSPPIREHSPWIRDAEEYHDSTEREAGIERCGEHVVVLTPPREILALNPLVEYDVDERPGAVVDTSSRRYVVCPDKDEWPVDKS